MIMSYCGGGGQYGGGGGGGNKECIMWAVGLTLGLVELPLSALYILVTVRSSENTQGLADGCGGSAFFNFIVANSVINWIMILIITMSLMYLWSTLARSMMDPYGNSMMNNYGGPTDETVLTSWSSLAIGVTYAVLGITAIAIIPAAMSKAPCLDIMREQTWGVPLLGVAGYINLTVDIAMALAGTAMFGLTYYSSPSTTASLLSLAAPQQNSNNNMMMMGGPGYYHNYAQYGHVPPEPQPHGAPMSAWLAAQPHAQAAHEPKSVVQQAAEEVEEMERLQHLRGSVPGVPAIEPRHG